MVPNDPRVLSGYGEVLVRTGKVDKGLELLNKAYELDPIPQGQSSSDNRVKDLVLGYFFAEDFNKLKIIDRGFKMAFNDLSQMILERKDHDIINDTPIEDIFEKVGDFGEALGIGFQIKDDLLNLEEEAGESKEYGKERGGDIREGKRTLITIHMLENFDQADSEKLKTILLKPAEETLDDDVQWVIEKAYRLGSLNTISNECTSWTNRTKSILNLIPSNDTGNILFELVDFLMVRSCLLYTSPSPRDKRQSRMPSSA